MSQWTHVLGVIKYDYWAQNCWSSDSSRKDKKPDCYDPIGRIKLLKKIYNKNRPEGSEGPVQVSVINSNRGPMVIISGDLRDFGRTEVEKIVKWLNCTTRDVEKENDLGDDDNTLSLRDYAILCRIEYYSKEVFIIHDKDKWISKETDKLIPKQED